MKKFISVLLATCIMVVGLSACGIDGASGNDDFAGTSFTINKDGTVSNTIVEDFAQSYYSQDGLKDMIDSSISEYTSENPGATISLKKCEVADSVATVTIEYGSAKVYSGFNGEDFFVGTITEANMAGYDLNMTLTDASDSSVTISKPQLLGMGDNHIVIIAAGEDMGAVRINTYDEILYVGSGVTGVSKKSADMNLSSGYGIIVFK